MYYVATCTVFSRFCNESCFIQWKYNQHSNKLAAVALIRETPVDFLNSLPIPYRVEPEAYDQVLHHPQYWWLDHVTRLTPQFPSPDSWLDSCRLGRPFLGRLVFWTLLAWTHWSYSCRSRRTRWWRWDCRKLGEQWYRELREHERRWRRTWRRQSLRFWGSLSLCQHAHLVHSS